MVIMERTIEFRVEIDKEKNYKIVSYEPESGMSFVVDAGSLRHMNDGEFEKKIGMEVRSWIGCWVDEVDAE